MRGSEEPNMSDAKLTSLLLLSAVFLGCSDQDVSPSGEPGPSAGQALTPVELVTRGKYLAENVTGCAGCHTPRDPMGVPIPGRYLAGGECFVRLDNGSCLNVPNLTNHETGLKDRTDAEIRRMIKDGIRPTPTGEEPLFPVMASFVLHGLTEPDLDAILAWLRTVPGVENVVPRRAPEFDPGPVNPLSTSGIPASRRGGRRGALGGATVLDPDLVPMPVPGYAESEAALRGRYLATQACLICHTRHLDPDPQWLDYTKFFAGGEEFDVGLPTIAFAGNITSDPETGIGDWSVQDIFEAIQQGTDKHGDGICPPMGGAPSGLTDGDALDIAHYIKSLPPVVGEKAEMCPFPPQ
jgi:mono/diheme cytochrome c family protein